MTSENIRKLTCIQMNQVLWYQYTDCESKANENSYLQCWQGPEIRKRNICKPTSCDVSGFLLGSLKEAFSFAFSPHPGPLLCPSPSWGHVSCQPPNFSTAIEVHRIGLPGKKKKTKVKYKQRCQIGGPAQVAERSRVSIKILHGFVLIYLDRT